SRSSRIVFQYPSVGATENILMAATLLPGETIIINAALEPEVFDLIKVLKKMGASIETEAPATIKISGVNRLKPMKHDIIPDRLEAGALLLAAAITKGSIQITNAQPENMDTFLTKLQEMGHAVVSSPGKPGISLIAHPEPVAVSFKTGPYPCFPTDLQAPMMAAQTVARGSCTIEETVFENRLMHVRELQKMGAHITVENQTASIKGAEALYGADVIASDIRASCSLVLAGLTAQGTTTMTGLHQWQRAYDGLEIKLQKLGADIWIQQDSENICSELMHNQHIISQKLK
ncbi:UDP-N-acetylglucosamine 1-carboxyvinyltransferase, partial [Candidatus Babeliales bacterium]|nr:UDP-N-acetylglucosamine 1-carboxyvinyltransferase [Candidatus Babeliales bacterium]